MGRKRFSWSHNLQARKIQVVAVELWLMLCICASKSSYILFCAELESSMYNLTLYYEDEYTGQVKKLY
jgi:hypothetical protein